MVVVRAGRLCGLSVMMMLRTALVPVAHLGHDAVVVTEHERRGGKRHQLAAQPDCRHEPDVRPDAHHHTSLTGRQFNVQSDSVETSFTSTRLPEYAACVHVAASATL